MNQLIENYKIKTVQNIESNICVVHQLIGLPTHCKRWFIVLLWVWKKEKEQGKRGKCTNRVCKATIPLIFASIFFLAGQREKEKKINYLLCCSVNENEIPIIYTTATEQHQQKHKELAYNLVCKARANFSVRYTHKKKLL